MKKIVDINAFRIDKQFDADFENFIPIWAEYWSKKDPARMILGQIMTSTQLLQLAIAANIKYDIKILDKQCKKQIKRELEATIKMLDL